MFPGANEDKQIHRSQELHMKVNKTPKSIEKRGVISGNSKNLESHLLFRVETAVNFLLKEQKTQLKAHLFSGSF